MAGRPKAQIDWDRVNKLLQAQCEGTAIASLLGIHANTLYEACKVTYKCNFSDYSAIKKTEGVELLKAKQYQVAMEGDRTMLVWLGKQYAGQRDKQDIEQTIHIPQLPEVNIKINGD